MSVGAEQTVSGIRADAFRVPTATAGRERPESDGTIQWSSTGVIVLRVSAGGETGLGYAYAAPSALGVIRDTLWDVVRGMDALDTGGAYWAMARSVRNAGWPGIAAGAVAAVDIALHDLGARLLGVSLTRRLGGGRTRVAAYGSGGFTDYTDDELTGQLGSWAADGIRAVKMKVGSHPDDDLRRVRLARAAVGAGVELFVDANGAYERKQALALADQFAAEGVTWFEEPVSSDDREGLRLLRDRVPAPIRVAAGEYGYKPSDFRDLLVAGSVDVLQADATRCGVTGFGIAADLARAFGVPLSAHTSPALHASVAAAHEEVLNIEYFHDHVRIEGMFFDGVPRVVDGNLVPELGVPGHGLRFKEADAEPFQVDAFAAGTAERAGAARDGGHG
ncbi:enolase C-terminal domain-like protein [Leifsonia sp. AG29]|uniref:enolase C-terminal domain-like protein n=1 Tax=Leifsonia sp. AG29 TaxID=2598860 RepID=UPI00131D79FB|nr:enolase C-terminal domain-like protein [Leifsonia sp. AG29]